MSIDFTPKTKRLLVGCIGCIGLIVTLGWAYGSIQADDALIPLSAIIAGCLSLLKGGE